MSDQLELTQEQAEEVAFRAACYIESGWTQSHMATTESNHSVDPKNPNACRFCLHGSALRSLDDLVFKEPEDYMDSFKNHWMSVNRKDLMEMYPAGESGDFIREHYNPLAFFNDNAAVSRHRVIESLYRMKARNLRSAA